jgi:integrase
MPKVAKLLPREFPDGSAVLNIPPSMSDTGKRAREFFPNMKKAWVRADELRERRRLNGESRRVMSPAKEEMAQEGYRRLEAFKERTGEDLNLLGCIDQAIADAEKRLQRPSVSLTHLFDVYRQKEARSDQHYNQLRQVGERVCKTVKVPVCDVEYCHLEKVVNQVHGWTKERYITTLKAVFNYAMKVEGDKTAWIDHNPALRFAKPNTPDKKPTETFSNAVVQKMLDTALKEELDFLPYLTLGLFCGLRAWSPELTNLLWQNVHLDVPFRVGNQQANGHIVIQPKRITKAKRIRHVCLADNAIAWLKAYRNQKAEKHSSITKGICPLTESEIRYARTRVFKKAIGKVGATFIQAGMRKTFASNHLFFFNDETGLIQQMGHHGGPPLLYAHYIRSLPYEAAQAFWKISPPPLPSGNAESPVVLTDSENPTSSVLKVR